MSRTRIAGLIHCVAPASSRPSRPPNGAVVMPRRQPTTDAASTASRTRRALWDAAPDAVDALGIVNNPPDPGTSRVRMVRAVAVSAPIDPVGAARHEKLLRRIRIMQSATDTDLRRVIPGPDARADGLRIASVELYGDWGATVWHTVGIEPRRQERRDPSSSFLDVSDDAGTDYATWSWGFGLLTNIESRAHHDAYAYQGRERFAPAPPPNASSSR